jgi:hypothetical protein
MPAMATRVRDEVLGERDARVEAYVVEPTDGLVRAGILFLHWLGDHRSDRTQFLSEARAYAELGVRSVLPAGRLPWVPDPAGAETDIVNLEVEQLRLGAALDRLGAGLPKRTPLALAARKPRFKAAVLIAATPRWADWFLRFWKVEADRFDYLRRLSPYDPITVARDLRALTLWQCSDRDFYIAQMSAIELARAAPHPAGSEPRIEWYSADHAMRSAKARAARAAFLGRELDLG